MYSTKTTKTCAYETNKQTQKDANQQTKNRKKGKAAETN